MLATRTENTRPEVSGPTPPPTALEDRRARFERLVAVHMPVLTRTAIRMCPNRETAEDVVQETLLRAWRHLDRLDDPAAIKGWLFTILRNERARALRRTPRHESGVDVDLLPAADGDPDIDRQRVRARVRAMPEKYGVPLAMFAYSGFDIEEIAAGLGITRATVKTRLFRARVMLREIVATRTTRDRGRDGAGLYLIDPGAIDPGARNTGARTSGSGRVSSRPVRFTSTALPTSRRRSRRP